MKVTRAIFVLGERVALVTLGLLMVTGCATGQDAMQEDALGMEDLPMPIVVTSSAFEEGESIPRNYSCDGEDISPPLTWSGVPAGAQSLVLIVDDPDAPRGNWLHWIVYDMEAGDGSLAEDAGQASASPGGGVQGNNSWRRADYGGPCPPGGTHRYFFTLYALDTRLGLDSGITRLQVERAMEGHVMGQGQLMGRYTR
jgi:Raf kinase inhibitor-like YbhB/YbcL family protein